MDDIRRPDPQRRDYSLPRANYTPSANPSALPAVQPEAQAPPQPIQMAPAPAAPVPQPPITPVISDSSPDYTPAPPQDVVRTPYQAPAPQPQPAPQPRAKVVHFFPYKYVAAAVAVLLILGAAGYFVSRPAKKTGLSADQLAKKSAFSFYYPQPVPSGYTYITEQNAFQDGQAYFMIGKGNKHIVFHEQTGSQLAAASLSKPVTIQTPGGKAVVGMVAGQPAAKVLAGSTLISVNTTGGVSQDDVKTAVQSLKTKE
jgi:hypothetical protein